MRTQNISMGKKHGLSGKGSRRTYRHSYVRHPEHEEYKARKPLRAHAIRMVPKTLATLGPEPVLLSDLSTPGDLTWRVKDDNLESQIGGEFVSDLDTFEAKVKELGAFREGNLKGDGTRYLQKADKLPALKRVSINLPPWFSLIWSQKSLAAREKDKDKVVKLMFELAKKRWPQVEIRNLSMHDDSNNLHVDIWGTELEIRKYRGKDVFVSKGRVFLSGSAGPGATYLKAKEDAGHVLHPEDLKMLRSAEAQYQMHRAQTAKSLPEEPAEFAFHRELDEKLSGFFSGNVVAGAKAEVERHWVALDKYKYGNYDLQIAAEAKAAELRDLQLTLKDEAAAVEVDKKAVAAEKAAVETEKAAVKSEKEDMLSEIESGWLEIFADRKVQEELKAELDISKGRSDAMVKQLEQKIEVLYMKYETNLDFRKSFNGDAVGLMALSGMVPPGEYLNNDKIQRVRKELLARIERQKTNRLKDIKNKE